MSINVKMVYTKHPSYGYATPDQIRDLERLGIGADRDKVLADIARQTKAMTPKNRK